MGLKGLGRRAFAVAAASLIGLPGIPGLPGLPGGLGLPGFLGGAGSHTAASTTGSPAGSGTTVLEANVLPGLSLLTPSTAPQAAVLHIGVALAERDPAGQAALERALYDPASPEYHRFLSPAAFADRFGSSPAAYSAVQRWLTAGGLHISSASGARNWVQATGTVAQVERLMHVSIAAYRSTKGVDFLANQQAPTVPAGVSIESVVGLNTLQRFSVPQQQRTAQSLPACLANLFCYYAPQDLWSIYDQPAADEGQGQTMAVFGEGQTDGVISDLRLFEKAFGLPRIPIQVRHVGAGPFTDDSGHGEWNIDTQASTGMAPQVQGETLYFAGSLSDADVETAFSSWAGDPNGPAQANASFGECEQNPLNPIWNAEPAPVSSFFGDGNNLQPVADSTLRQATLEGRTLFASSGDTGSSCPILGLPVIGAGNGVVNQVQPLMNYPCASQFVVCVGGTMLYSDGGTPPQRSLEIAWTHGGGGSSLFNAEPSFQQGVANINRPCLVDPNGNPYPAGTTCRGVPDVAAVSGDDVAFLTSTNAYDIYSSGQATTGGGTSLSSPLWVGMWARVQAAAPKGGLGFADPTIYAVGTGKLGSYARDFTDITVGTNGLYQAGPGWDYTTGWGVPDVTNLVKDLDGKLTPTDDIPPPPLPATPASKVVLPCGVLWANPAHTASDLVGNSDPQLTLDQGSMGTSADGSTLQVKLTMQDLSETVPAGAVTASWYGTWTYKGTEYFANAVLSALPGAQPSFSDGYHDAQGYHSAHTDTGSFGSGPNGVVEIDVPLADVGSPPAKADLIGPAAVTYTGYGVPPNPSGKYLVAQSQVDTGGPTDDYLVGSTCAAATVASVKAAHTGAGANAAGGGRLAETGLVPWFLLGLLVEIAGLALVVSDRPRRWSRSGTEARP